MQESGAKIFDMISKHEADKHSCVGCDRAISAAERPKFLTYVGFLFPARRQSASADLLLVL